MCHCDRVIDSPHAILCLSFREFYAVCFIQFEVSKETSRRLQRLPRKPLKNDKPNSSAMWQQTDLTHNKLYSRKLLAAILYKLLNYVNYYEYNNKKVSFKSRGKQ